nr:unnamed protein product [Spirometra erinaceieuropaei]
MAAIKNGAPSRAARQALKQRLFELRQKELRLMRQMGIRQPTGFRGAFCSSASSSAAMAVRAALERKRQQQQQKEPDPSGDGWALLSGHTPGNRLDRRAKPGEGAVHLCRVHSVPRTPPDGWSDETLRRQRRDEALPGRATGRGVAYALRNGIVGRLPYLPQGTNEYLVGLRLPLRGGKFVSVHALPMASPDEARNKFYENLHALLVTVLAADNLIFLGDFNARVGTDRVA